MAKPCITSPPGLWIWSIHEGIFAGMLSSGTLGCRVKFAAGLKDLFFTLAPGLFNNALI
jgi:hypothetical protein